MVVVDGLTLILDPAPTDVPPQDPEYHFHEAPVPKEPPLTESVVMSPLQMVEGLAVADVGAVDEELTVMVMLLQLVVLHVPSALT